MDQRLGMLPIVRTCGCGSTDVGFVDSRHGLLWQCRDCWSSDTFDESIKPKNIVAFADYLLNIPWTEGISEDNKARCLESLGKLKERLDGI